MRLVFVLVVVLVLLNLSFARDSRAYCSKSVLRQREVRPYGESQYVKKTVIVCCKGYTKLRGKCVPLCEDLCMNAKCVAPNVCKCKSGFKELNKFRCEPICDDCKFGLCTAPGICTCYSDYRKNATTGKCEPKCDPPCINGYCSEPNFCLCDRGYQMTNPNTNICIRRTTTEAAPVTTEHIEETSTQLPYVPTTDEPLHSSSSVAPIRQTFSTKEGNESDHPTENAHTPDTAIRATTEEALSNRGPNEYTIHQDLVKSKYSKDNIDVTSSESKETTKAVDIQSSSDNLDIYSTTVQGISETSTSNKPIRSPTSAVEEHPTEKDISTENKEISFDMTTDNDIQFVPDDKLKYSTELPSDGGTTKGSETNDSSIIKEEINSSPDTVIIRIPSLIATLAALVIVVLILMIAFARKCFQGKEYNIARLEKRKGIASYSSGKDNVITAW